MGCVQSNARQPLGTIVSRYPNGHPLEEPFKLCLVSRNFRLAKTFRNVSDVFLKRYAVYIKTHDTSPHLDVPLTLCQNPSLQDSDPRRHSLVILYSQYSHDSVEYQLLYPFASKQLVFSFAMRLPRRPIPIRGSLHLIFELHSQRSTSY